MKQLIILLLFTVVSQAQKVQSKQIGKIADSVSTRVLTFNTKDTVCSLYYQVFDASKKQIEQGNINLTPEEFKKWSKANDYIDGIVLSKLNLTRK